MNCAACGNAVPQGAQVCPVCGAPVNAGYQQSYAQYQPGAYPPGYQTPCTYTPPSREDRGLLPVLSALPRAFVDSFSQPGEVLRGMVEKRDLLSGPIVALLVLVMSFLGGVVIMRGFISELYAFVASLSGNAGGTAAAVNQGVTYIAGRIAPSVGGVAALCQLISMAVPTAVFMVYICWFCRVTFSWELALGFLAVISMNTVAVSLAAMALALLSPWLAVAVMAAGAAISYTQACGMLGLITARADQTLLRAKILLTAVSIVLTLVVAGVVGGLLMNGVIRHVFSLLSTVGSLI